MKLKIKKGLNIPIQGAPSDTAVVEVFSSSLSVDFKPFSRFKIKILVKEGDEITKNQVLGFFKNAEIIKFRAPCSGKIKKIHRGQKRLLQEIVIEKSEKIKESLIFSKINLEAINQEELIQFLGNYGAFSLIKMLPFDLPAIPQLLPKEIFINLAENEPFAVPIDKQLLAFHSTEEALFYFEKGIEVLFKILSKKIKIIYRNPSFTFSKKVKEVCDCIEIEGPYPSGCSAVQIYKVAPIRSEKDITWVLSFSEVSSLGHLVEHGFLYNKKIIALAGPSLKEAERKYIKTEIGASLREIIPQRIKEEQDAVIQGSPLFGFLVNNIEESSLSLFTNIISIIPKNTKREFLHFLKLGTKKFTATRTYLSGFLKFMKNFEFTTNQHGELRAFIDPSVYNSIMPMDIPIVNLAKAILAENFELAKQLGFLEISKEACVLATFICPSKNNILEIIQQGQEKYVQESDFLPFH